MKHPKLPTHTTVGLRLKACRQMTGLTLPKAARIAGMSKGYLWQLENGRIPAPSLFKIAMLARVYGMKLDLLMEAE